MSLKYALLGLLAENPKYGYEIKRQFEGALGNVWSVSYGQLYPKKAAEKNIYSITAEGKKRLDEWLLKPLRTNYRVKDEFTLKFLFFDKIPKEKVLNYLKSQQKKTIMQKENFQRTLVSIREEINFFLQAIIRKGIIHLEAENQWLEEVINDLQ